MSLKQRYVAVLANSDGEVITAKGVIASLVLASQTANVKASGKAVSSSPRILTGDQAEQSTYDARAKSLGIPSNVLKAVVAVESGSVAFKNGKPIARFEPHIFNRMFAAKASGVRRVTAKERRAFGQTVILPGMQIPKGVKVIRTSKLGNRLVAGYDVKSSEGLNRFSDKKRTYAERQMVEWDAINLASQVDQDLAYQSVLFGLGQIMGFNHTIVGYTSAAQMVSSFTESVWSQRLAIISFIENYSTKDGPTGKTVLEALRTRDYDAFARVYNGDKKGIYAARIREKLNQ